MKKEIIALDASTRYYDKDGRLHIPRTHITKAGVRPYRGREIPNSHGLGLDPDRIYSLLCPPDELKKSVEKWKNLQILSRHIKVDAEEPKQEDTVGSIGSDPIYEHPYLDNSMCVWEVDAIEGVEDETKREISAGYHYVAVMTPGEYEGEKYDGYMTDIEGNHVTFVPKGRAGPDVLAADEDIFNGDREMKKNQRLKALTEKAHQALKDRGIAMDAEPEAIEEVIQLLEGEIAENKIVGDNDDKKENVAEEDKPVATDQPTTSEGALEPSFSSSASMDEGEIQRRINEAVEKAVAEAVSKANIARDELHEAKKETEESVGEIASDSAEDIYKTACERAGIEIKGVHPSALRAIWQVHQKTASSGHQSIAMDSASVKKMADRFPEMSRIGKL